MTDKPGEKINNLTPAPPSSENNKYKVEYWFYFKKDEKFVLRIGAIIENPDQIRFELLNTEELSEEPIIYAQNFERDELVEYLELGGNKKLDPKTYLAKCMYISLEKCDSNECIIKVITENNETFTAVLKKSENEDKIFFKANAYRKVLQMKQKLKTLNANLIEKNENLKKENEYIKKELDLIKKSNISLSKENESISGTIKKAKEIQEKAIDQLEGLLNEA